MAELSTEVVECRRCAFWQQLDRGDGRCRRHAPATCENPDQIAHWPLTRAEQFCGEGVVAATADVTCIRCDACIFWGHMTVGLDPMSRLDQRIDWWRSAGHCVKFAPVPSNEPAPRAYWRATNAADCCFDGKPKRS